MGYKVFLESSIMQKGLPATAGSKMLENFIAPVDATVASRLLDAGHEIAGRVDTSEFGIAGLFAESLNTGGRFSCVLTDEHKRTVPLCSGEADVVLCNDFTGTISRIAAENGLYYIQPTYGIVSRFGMIPSVCSIDQIGILCKDPKVGFEVLDTIKGYDEKDGVMEHKGATTPALCATPPRRGIDCFVPCNDRGDDAVMMRVVLQVICCAEFSNNISRYDGIKFGYRAKGYNGLEELYKKSRTEGFSEDVKFAAIVGARVLYGEGNDRVYEKAMKIRRIIKDSFKFEDNDVLKTDCIIAARLGGFPTLTTPDAIYVAAAGNDKLLEVAYEQDGASSNNKGVAK